MSNVVGIPSSRASHSCARPASFLLRFAATLALSAHIITGYGARLQARSAQVALPPGVVIAPLGMPRILVSDAATLARLRQQLNSGAPSATRFKGYVDSEMSGTDNYGFEPWHAALMGQAANTTNYCSFAVARQDTFVQSEEALIDRGQRPLVADDHYLQVGDIVGGLSMVYDWCRPQMNDSQRLRWRNYANQAVWNVWNPEDAFWGNKPFPDIDWGRNDPENNYYYSFLRATMLLGLATYDESSMASDWLNIFRIEKIQDQLVPAFNADLQGGGSREGTGYGTALGDLFDLYHLWEKSTTERIADLTSHTLASLDKAMHDIAPTLDRIAPTGDHARDSTAALFDYHRKYLEVLAHLYRADTAAGVAKTLLAQSSVPRMAYGFNYWADFVYDLAEIPAQPLNRLSTAHWGSGTGQYSMRSTWDKTASYANFICGPYTQSHAHPDQGSFVFFKGNWLAYDENIATHSGLAAIQEAHNLVRIEKDGRVIDQKWLGHCQMKALADTPTFSYGLALLTPMYQGSPSVTKLEREFLMVKPGVLVVFDRVNTSGSGIQRIWTLNVPGTPTVNKSRLKSKSGGNLLSVARLAPSGLTSEVISWPSLDHDEYYYGSRIDAAHSNGSSTEFLHVLGADRAYQSVKRSDASGQIGAQVVLANGDTATVRFNVTTTGGSLEVLRSDGSVVFSGNLPTTVQVPPRFAAN